VSGYKRSNRVSELRMSQGSPLACSGMNRSVKHHQLKGGVDGFESLHAFHLGVTGTAIALS